MSLTNRKIIWLAGCIVLLAMIVAGIFIAMPRPVKEPNSLERTYSLKDFSYEVKKNAEAPRFIKRLNTDIAALRNKSTENPYITWIDIGNLKVALLDYTGARAAYEQAITVRDFAPLAYLNLGTLYKMHLHDYPKAEYYYLLAHSKIDYPFFSDYESLSDLYVNYYTEKKVDIERLMLEGADKSKNEDKVPYYSYLYDYFFGKDTTKVAFYKQKVLAIDPAYTFQR
jgi:hypothetical protein